ncbi:MAG: chloride channel protein [Desulfovibrionaceae bacterium]
MATRAKGALLPALTDRLNPRNLALWSAAAVCGLLAALAAEALNWALDATLDGLRPYRTLWWAAALPAAGAAAAVLLKDKVFCQTEREGVPRVIASVCRGDGRLDPRSSVTDLLYCVLSLGSGGSVGPEGPIVGSGAAIGSNMVRLFRLPENYRITLAACGASGAIAAIFNAPATGIIFALEIILGAWTSFYLVPIAISALAATWLARQLSGGAAAFQATENALHGMDWMAVLAVVVFAVAVSVAFARLIRMVHQQGERLARPEWLRAAAGGLLVGVMGLFMPMVLGEGYLPTMEAINNNFPGGLVVAAAFVAAKLLATSLSLGTGAPGGIFAPCLVLGSTAGLACFRSLEALLPGRYASADETGFALMGMAGVVSGVMQAPLTGLVLVLEITASHGAIFPLMVTVLAAAVLSHHLEPTPFYFKPLVDSGEYAPPKSDLRILSRLRLADAIDDSRMRVAPDVALGEFMRRLKGSLATHIPVVEEDGRYRGMNGPDQRRGRPRPPAAKDRAILSLPAVSPLGAHPVSSNCMRYRRS